MESDWCLEAAIDAGCQEELRKELEEKTKAHREKMRLWEEYKRQVAREWIRNHPEIMEMYPRTRQRKP
jgi:hypothetical protein